MSQPPSAYPLAWPEGWPRTGAGLRQRGTYRTSLAGALSNLRSQVRMLAGAQAAGGLVLSSNVTLGSERPSDPGVVAWFVFDKMAVSIPCDRWQVVEHNVQAIALTIEAMRAMDRHGAKHMIRAMFQGFVALPPPGAGQQHWSDVIGIAPDAPLAAVEAAYRRAAASSHPDKPGGSQARMATLNIAMEQARKERGA